MASKEEIAAIFTGIAARIDPTKASDLNATIQFELSGDSGGSYWLKFENGTAEAGEGAIADPKMTLRTSADDFAGMVAGKLNPMQAFMMGKIKIQGDTGIAMKLMPMING